MYCKLGNSATKYKAIYRVIYKSQVVLIYFMSGGSETVITFVSRFYVTFSESEIDLFRIDFNESLEIEM